MKKSSLRRALTLSDHLYHFLLWAYPAAFRGEYGPPMAQVFRDECRTVYRQSGLPGLINLWVPTLLDLVVTALKERLAGGFYMSVANLIRWSGPAFMAGSVLFIIGMLGMTYEPGPPWDDRLGGSDVLYEVAALLTVPGVLLLLVGLAGMHARFANQMGAWGSLGLIMSEIGAVLIAVFPPGSFDFLYFQQGFSWAGFVFGLLLLHTGMLPFGLEMMQRQLLPRWNGLPLLIGLPLLPVWLITVVFDPAWLSEPVWLLALLGLGWGLLGYVLQTGQEPEPVLP